MGEQNPYTRAADLVGDRNPRQEEFSIQMRPMDADKSGMGLGLPVVIALCGSVLGRNTHGGTIVVGALNLGGSVEMVPNAVRIAELAIDKQAQTLLMPVSARRQLNDLPEICGRASASSSTRTRPTPYSKRWSSNSLAPRWLHSQWPITCCSVGNLGNERKKTTATVVYAIESVGRGDRI